MPKKRFLALGECMIELSQNPGTKGMSRSFAGDTFNTAWYAVREFRDDWIINYFTAIGTDKISTDFLGFAHDAGLDLSDVIKRTDRTLGLYMIHLDQGERSFTYWRNNSAAKTLASSNELLTNVMERADVVYFSGITIAILDDGGRRNLHNALTEARAKGKTIIFDPNLRPKLWSDNEEMQQSTNKFAQCSDLIMPSFEDEQIYFGDTDIVATAFRYSKLGTQLVVVKNRDKEILLCRGSELCRFSPPKVSEPVDTTAAGDSFNAGFLSAYLAGSQLDDAVRAGCELAAQVICNHGALIETTLLKPKMVNKILGPSIALPPCKRSE